MNLQEKLAALEDIMELEAGTLAPEMELEDIDSLSSLDYIYLAIS